ncbi:MAG: condensation domain-containing protein, partial [Candidatus Eremiobacteraeota bacterium]|nr:condensation domain-containing protein [Candidatus Eremiobacteraeota bacterium]
MTDEVVILPVSFGQELLWSIERAAPGRSAYNVPRTWRLRGKLDREALQAALGGLVARHEILRTTYAVRDDEPVQVIHPARALDVTFADLSDLEFAEALAEAERRTRAAAGVPFDLTRDLPFRATILRLAPDEHVLHVDSHHIASDGGSRDILVREVGELYRAAAKGTAAQLPELPIQYGDYAEWERGHLAGERLEGLLTYWREELAGAAFTLDVPADVPSAPAANDEATTRTLTFDAPFVDALKNFARRHDATLYMLLLAAYQALLQRYSGQSDVLVGSPVAGRSQPETEGLIGYFASMVVQRARFSGDPTMAQLLAQVRASSLGAFDHCEMPFEKLVLELHAGGDFRRSPIFQAVFTALESDEGGSLRIGDLEASQLGNPVVTTKFDLTLFMRERVDGVTLSLRARSTLWTPATIERFLRQLRVLLASAIAAPDERVSQLAIFDASELAEFAAWNATTIDEGAPASLDALIEATAARVSGRTALVAGDASVTYAELDARALRLAVALRARGVVAGSRVGVLLDRSVDAVVAILAVLRTGAAYVPLSPDAPAARLARQIDEC